jgi:hypothetical protein
MARAWLSSNLLPPAYWRYAVKRATEVSNYMPLKIHKYLTTPFEAAYSKKPDPLLLFPMFSLAYVRKVKDGNIKRVKFRNASIKCILIGKCSKSNAYMFYDPISQQEITSIDFTFDSTLPTGPIFDLKYDRNISINRMSDGFKHIAPLYAPETTVILTTSPEREGIILHVPTSKEPVYTILFPDGSVEQHEEQHIIPTTARTINPTATFPDWIKHHAPARFTLKIWNDQSKAI